MEKYHKYRILVGAIPNISLPHYLKDLCSLLIDHMITFP